MHTCTALKKTISLLTAIVLLLCVAGCKKKPSDSSAISDEVEIVYEYIDESNASEGSKESAGSSSAQSSKQQRSYKTASSGSTSSASPDKGGTDTSSEKGGGEKVLTVDGTVTGYITSGNKSYKLNSINSSQITVTRSRKTASDKVISNIEPDAKYQKIEGFGGALTDSSCANLNQMSAPQRNLVMTSLFDTKNGIGLNYLRQPCGVTDYAVDWHTYDDMPEGQTDMNLEHFSIDCDREYILPYIKQALSLNSDIKVISSVWSPPLWMKTKYEWTTTPEDGNLNTPATESNTAMLKRDCYDVFANYLVKYIQAYVAEGIPITSIVPQNEPTGRHGIPAAYYTADRMSELINNHIAPAFKNSGINTEIWSWDFNFFEDDAFDFTGGAINNIQGIAMHYPSNDCRLITSLKYAFDRPVYLTETGSGSGDSFENLTDNVCSIIDWLQAGASAVIRWNLTLDEYGGPSDSRNPHIRKSPNKYGGGLIGFNTSTNTVTNLADYYAMGHFSKFIKRGAYIIHSDDMSLTDEFISNVSAVNPDGSIVTVMANQSPRPREVILVFGDTKIEYKIPGTSVVTFVWNSAMI